MSVFRILLDELPPAGSIISVPDEQAHHLRHVRRVTRGEKIECLDRHGRCAPADIATLEPELCVTIGAWRTPAPAPPCALTLLPALLPEDRFDIVLQKCTELGVPVCIPLITEFTVVKLHKEPQHKRARWQRICDDAARQCGGAPMQVAAPLAFDDALACTRQLRLIADRTGSDLCELIAPRAPAEVAVMIGPEGGWSDTEVAAAQAAGWRATRLHQNVLRAETAAIVAAALLLVPGFGDPLTEDRGPRSGNRTSNIQQGMSNIQGRREP